MEQKDPEGPSYGYVLFTPLTTIPYARLSAVPPAAASSTPLRGIRCRNRFRFEVPSVLLEVRGQFLLLI